MEVLNISQINESILDTIGNTPLVHLKKLSRLLSNQVYGKYEATNPGGSIKDRIAKAMIEEAEKQGQITDQTVLIEPTSGNTGIGLAIVAAVKGYSLILVMPESMSIERRQLLSAFGAQIKLTPASLGMQGAIQVAEQLGREMDDAYLLQQFKNSTNPLIHYQTTGPEIWSATKGKLDIFVAGVGTGGTITGVGKFLKEQNPDVEIIAVEPADSPVISGGKPGPHKIQGIGAGFIPDNLNTAILDDVVQVDNDEAGEYARRLAKEDGILAGISSGAAIAAAVKVASRPENKGKRIATLFASCGERYLSTWLYEA